MNISNVIKIIAIAFFRGRHLQFALIAYQKEYYWKAAMVCFSLLLMILQDSDTKASLHTATTADAVTG